MRLALISSLSSFLLVGDGSSDSNIPSRGCSSMVGPIEIEREWSAITGTRCSQNGYLVTTLLHLIPLRHVSHMLFDCPPLICLSVRFLSFMLNLIALPPIAKLSMYRHILIALFRSQLPTWLTQYPASLIVFRHTLMARWVHLASSSPPRTGVRRWCRFCNLCFPLS